MAIPTGARLAHYEVVSLLGTGGMGEVYLARDTRLDRKAALKLLSEEFLRDTERMHRFEQEARVASALNHPNIITVYEIGHAGEQHFIATEFVDGQTLREKIKHGQMAMRDMLDIAKQIAEALAAAHEAGIVHRDIKPENVMVRPDGLVKVLDFGLAKQTEKRSPTVDPNASTAGRMRTDPGTVMGTPHYMSPEQARGVTMDSRTDIFSLGIVLYEMVARRTPFEGETTSDLIAEILKTEPPPIADFAPGAPMELQRIISRAMQKKRDARFQSAREFQLALKALKHELKYRTKENAPQPAEVAAGSETPPPAAGRNIDRSRHDADFATKVFERNAAGQEPQRAADFETRLFDRNLTGQHAALPTSPSLPKAEGILPLPVRVLLVIAALVIIAVWLFYLFR